MRRLVCFLGLFALTGATCQIPSPPSTSPEKREAALRAFQSADEMQQYLASQAIARLSGRAPNGGWPVFFLAESAGSPVRDTDSTAGAPQAAGGGTMDPFSTTNTQEAGVDESDLVKNDGRFIYLIKGNTLRIVKARPPNALEQVASVELPDNPDSLYLRGDKLIAVSRSWGWWGGWGGWEGDVRLMDVAQGGGAPACAAGSDCGYGVNRVTVTVLDVTDRAAPVTAATIKLEGSLASTRMIENRLYVVLTSMPPLPDNPTPEAIKAQPLEQWLPDYQIVTADGASAAGDIVGWQTSYYPVNPDGYGLTIVATLDVDNPGTLIQSEAVAADAGTIYASTSALYVTDTQYDVDGNGREDTAVHKFALTEEGAVYRASGLIPGRLLNQYSLGEKDGYLRTAVSVEDWSRWFDDVILMSETTNGDAAAVTDAPAAEPSVPGTAVYVLRENTDTDKLEIVGRIEGIKPDERLYSARFVGDRGFLVTFRRVDPLFTLDLSDPTKPVLVGELKVPGYSEYIHLMDENHLLTIGHDADEDTGMIGGLKLSIFDVTDPAKPVEAHERIIGSRGTSSEATWNPKAFNYFAAKAALAFPATIYEGSPWGRESDYGSYFNGLLVYRVTAEGGFTLLGRISTRLEGGDCDYCGYAWPSYTRGVFIGDDVYAVTDSVVRAAPISDPAALSGSLELPGSAASESSPTGVTR